jgi:glutamyl/glutaminyl-tRNA synthetase
LNTEKLDWMNQQHIQRLSREELVSRLEGPLRDAGLWRDEFMSSRRDWFIAVAELYRPRIRKLDQFVDEARPLLSDAVEYDPAAVAKHLKDDVRGPLSELADSLAAVEPFDAPALEAELRRFAEARGMKAATLIHASRVAVTGRSASPGLFEMLELAGRDRVLSRLRTAVQL